MTTNTISHSFTIDRTLTDDRLLGAALGNITPWETWLVALKSAFALGFITDRERELFNTIAGGRSPPEHRVRELWCLVGRRGGKSRVAAALAVFFAAFVPHKHKVAKGERPLVLVLALIKPRLSSITARHFLSKARCCAKKSTASRGQKSG
jgi:hypothetical protein